MCRRLLGWGRLLCRGRGRSSGCWRLRLSLGRWWRGAGLASARRRSFLGGRLRVLGRRRGWLALRTGLARRSGALRGCSGRAGGGFFLLARIRLCGSACADTDLRDDHGGIGRALRRGKDKRSVGQQDRRNGAEQNCLGRLHCRRFLMNGLPVSLPGASVPNVQTHDVAAVTRMRSACGEIVCRSQSPALHLRQVLPWGAGRSRNSVQPDAKGTFLKRPLPKAWLASTRAASAVALR